MKASTCHAGRGKSKREVMLVNIHAVLADWERVPETISMSLAFLTILLKNTRANVITQCV
jgi:hypothetical protein